MSLEAYRHAVDQAMLQRFGLTWRDAGGDDAVLEQARVIGEEPEAFVSWWGAKYGLDGRAFGRW